MMKDRIILIDCGKSFMQSAIAHFPTHGITRIDAVVLTHGHADACFGMDDLRAVSARLPKGESLPVYVREMDLKVLESAFSYLMPDANHGRFVASLSFHVFDPAKPLNVLGLELIPIELEHGIGYTCLGYAFGDVVYMSDLNRIYDHTRELLTKRYKFGSLPHSATPEEIEAHRTDPRVPLNTFIIDALFPAEPYPSHFSLEQAVEEIQAFRPSLALTVGMSHQMNHNKDNEKLKALVESHNLRVELAYDGQKLHINL
jgi:phosphoribosyl 1,2-cyclic phosphodiesterase